MAEKATNCPWLGWSISAGIWEIGSLKLAALPTGTCAAFPTYFPLIVVTVVVGRVVVVVVLEVLVVVLLGDALEVVARGFVIVGDVVVGRLELDVAAAEFEVDR